VAAVIFFVDETAHLQELTSRGAHEVLHGNGRALLRRQERRAQRDVSNAPAGEPELPCNRGQIDIVCQRADAIWGYPYPNTGLL